MDNTVSEPLSAKYSEANKALNFVLRSKGPTSSFKTTTKCPGFIKFH